MTEARIALLTRVEQAASSADPDVLSGGPIQTRTVINYSIRVAASPRSMLRAAGVQTDSEEPRSHGLYAWPMTSTFIPSSGHRASVVTTRRASRTIAVATT